MKNQPIGVFDSGLGGLTVVKQLRNFLPNEDIIYFGDTGRVPYGTKSENIIKKYTLQDCNFLLSQNVKMVVSACGTASSVAPQIWQNLSVFGIGVVSSAAHDAVSQTKNGKVGIIATPATIKTDAFGMLIRAKNPDIEVFNQSCPIFVSLVENGWNKGDDEIALLAAKRYLTSLKAKGVDTLVLGCTHFPLLYDVISSVMGAGVSLIDTGFSAARYAKKVLASQNILNNQETAGHVKFFVSDRPQDFSAFASLCLDEKTETSAQVIDIDSF